MEARAPAGDPLSYAAQAGSPTVLRIALGGQLRALREGLGISPDSAGEAIRASPAKISRLECGRVGFKLRDIRDLLTLYQVTDTEQREQFLQLAQQANRPGWWHQYGDLLPPWFETYVGLEQAAESIRCYEPQFVPGLLQTPEYARAVVMIAHHGEPEGEIRQRVSLRMRRQQILRRPRPPLVWAVLDEAALRRPIGGADVLRGQIERLLAVAALPQVTLQVLPYTAGGPAAAGGPFTILRFPEAELPDVVYLEQLTSALYLDKRRDLDQYLTVMNRLALQAATPEESRRLLTAMLDN